MLDPAARKEANVSFYDTVDLPLWGLSVPSPDSVLRTWSNALWEQLARRRFAERADPRRLAWRRSRSANQHNGNLKWRQLDQMAKKKGLSGWHELVKDTEPDWYEVLKSRK